jgi:hypothetical protein
MYYIILIGLLFFIQGCGTDATLLPNDENITVCGQPLNPNYKTITTSVITEACLQKSQQ